MKKSTCVLTALLAVSAFAQQNSVTGTVYHRYASTEYYGNAPARYAGVTLKTADTTVVTETDSLGKYLIMLDNVDINTAPSVQKTGAIRINGAQLSFEGSMDIQKIIMSDLRGRQLFSQSIRTDQKSINLPHTAAGYRLITLVNKSGQANTVSWISGTNRTATGMVNQPVSHSSSLRSGDTESFPDTLTITSDNYSDLVIPVNVKRGILPADITMIDQTDGEATDITVAAVQAYENQQEMDTLVQYDNEGFKFLPETNESELVLWAENSYTTLVKPEQNGGFFPVDMDTVTSPETGVYGTVFSVEGVPYYPDNSPIEDVRYNLCYTYEGTEINLCSDDTATVLAAARLDFRGKYYFPDIPEGNYCITLPEYMDSDFDRAVHSFSTSESRRVDMFGAFYHMAVAPNIYLYPEETSDISVEVNVRDGGSIPYSIPQYNGGWNVTATPEGTIDDSLGFLYYDFYSGIPYQSDSGWVINYHNFDNEISDLLTSRGLNAQEILDFIDFWKPFLTDNDWVTFCPIDADKMVELVVEPEPVTLFRELYLVIPSKGERPVIKEPARGVPFERKGFTVVEWGGHLKGLKLGEVIDKNS